jgi:hypothetical protein
VVSQGMWCGRAIILVFIASSAYGYQFSGNPVAALGIRQSLICVGPNIRRIGVPMAQASSN